jgi:hypothetical protein
MIWITPVDRARSGGNLRSLMSFLDGIHGRTESRFKRCFFGYERTNHIAMVIHTPPPS